MDLLKKLVETPGVSGREERVRELMKRELSVKGVEFSTDPMGNLVAVRKPDKKSPKSKRVMFCAHMDEIGFYARSIEEKTGFVRVNNVGGFDARHLFSRRVIAYGKTDIVGILNPGGRPTHIATPEDRKKIPEITDLVIDFGMSGKKVSKLVEPGTPVALYQTFSRIGDFVTGKAMDNRVACWVVIRLLQRLKNCPHEVIVVATVQEEVGLRGAMASVFKIDPDIGVAIDTTLACDTPGVADHETISRLGKGVALKVMDGSLISHRGILEKMREVATKGKIPYQLEVLPRGGTDGGALQRYGASRPAMTVSIPTRYIHTTCETVSPKDLDSAVKLLEKWLVSPELVSSI